MKSKIKAGTFAKKRESIGFCAECVVKSIFLCYIEITNFVVKEYLSGFVQNVEKRSLKAQHSAPLAVTKLLHRLPLLFRPNLLFRQNLLHRLPPPPSPFLLQ